MNVRLNRVGRVALTGMVAFGLLAAGPADAAGRTAQAQTHAATATASGRYIVTLRGLASNAVSGTARGQANPSEATTAAARTAEIVRVARIDSAIAHVTARYAIRPRDTYHYALQGFAARLDPSQIAELRADPSVLSITAVRPVYLSDDDVPAGVERVGASPPPDGPTLPDLSDVSVAVLDTGIRYVDHDPKLNIAGGIDCANDSRHGRTGHLAWQDVDSGEGHGTHVSGTLAAEKTATGSDADIVGVAPGVRLYAVRIFSSNQGSISGDTATVACGVDWVASTRSDNPPIPHPIDIANMSIQGPIAGGDGASCPEPASGADAEHVAICTATAMGVTFVVAAGNSARNAAYTVPADYDSVITVSAMSDYDGKPGALAPSEGCGGPDDSFASYSNYGSPVDVIAPGTCVESLSTTAGHTRELSGTSMATPHVSGAAARYVALLLNNGAQRADIDADLIRDGLRAAANFDWTTSSDPDGNPDRLLDVANLETPTKAVNAWAFPALTMSGAPSGDDTTVESTISVELQRAGRYSGNVAIATDATMNGDPVAGVTVTPADPILSGFDAGGISTTVQVSLPASVPNGDILVTVHATPTGPGSGGMSASTASATVRVDHDRPTIDSFSASVVGNVQLGNAQPVTLTWTGSDAGTGIARYEIQRQVGNSGWMPFSLSPQDATSAVRLIALKTDYQFRVRAIDGVGNTSDWSLLTVRIGARDSGNAAISYSSDQSWTTRTKAKAFGGSFRRSTTPGAFAALSFTGRGVAWVAPVAPGRGMAKVYVDGTDSAHLVATVSLSATKQKDRMIVWASGALAPGSHTLVIKVVSGTVDLDAILLVKS